MQKLFAVVALALATQGAVGVAVWGQCGGSGYSGSSVCDSGSTCVYSNPYYSQCQPGSAPSSVSSSSTVAPTSTASTTKSTAPSTTVSSAPAGPTPPQGYSQITANIGSNPNNVGLYVYKPKVLAANPPLIVAMHYCQGSAQAYYTGTKYAQLAEQKGYYVIYPNSPRSGSCWDVYTNATLTHNGGSDSLGIVNAVRYAIAHWGVDASRVFATGSSSGAMMTSVMMGAYPDIYKAGAVDSGVAYGCFAGNNLWNSQCAQGDLIQSGQAWGNLVRAGYPGYTGPRPSVQVWHGTADTILYPQNFFEEIKQWTNVFGYPSTPVSNVSMTSQGFPAGYSNATYGPKFQAILAQNVGHTVPVFETNILAFFGL